MRGGRFVSWLGAGVLAAWASLPVQALDPERLSSQYTAHEWSMDDGLPENTVQVLRQCRSGYLWLGTPRRGLVRFDGDRFVVWPIAGTPEEDEVSVRALCETRDGSLWAGTDGQGLWCIARGETRRFGAADGLPNERVWALAEDTDGTLWIGLEGRALAHWRAGLLTPVAVPPDGPDSIRHMFQDSRGRLWLAGQGLWYAEAGGFIDARRAFDLPQDEFTHVCEDREGAIWVATLRGLVRLHEERAVIYFEADGLADDQVQVLHLDRDGNLWVGTNSGLDRFDGLRFVHCRTKERASYDLARALTEDREGSLWIATHGGLTRLREEKIWNITTRQGLPQNPLIAVLEAQDESLWMSTWTRGVARWKDGQVTVHDKLSGLPRDSMRCLHEDRFGVIWAGTQAGGLTRITDAGMTTFGQEGPLAGRRISAVQDDPEGHLWALAEDGSLFRFREEIFHPVAGSEGFDGAGVGAIHQGGAAGFWAATDAGLHERRGGEWQFHPFPPELSPCEARFLFTDREGEVWLGVASEGLLRFRAGRFTAYTGAQGLWDEDPSAMLQDAERTLWFASANGVFAVRREDFDRLDRGEIHRLSCAVFSEHDGMSSRTCMQAGFPSAAQTRDGQLLFATDRGLAVIDPARLRRNTVAPPVVIESVILNRRTVEPERVRTLPAGTREMEIRYTGLSLRAPERVRFRYRLEPYDPDWVEAGGRRTAHYQNLAPGAYRFRVSAANEDGVWSDAAAELAFLQAPFFHQTGWFYGSCGLAALLGAGWMHRRRVNQAKARFAALLEERTRIARDLHDTVEQGLVSVSMQLNLAQAKFARAPENAVTHLEKARYMLRHSLTDARAAITGLRHGGGPRPSLWTEISRVTETLSTEAGASIHPRLHGPPRALASHVEEALARIAQEALTNAVKHARARAITLELRYAPAAVTLIVQDDGVGFDPVSAPGPAAGRYGLLGMRERVEKLGGSLTVESGSGRGAAITATIPISQTAPGRV